MDVHDPSGQVARDARVENASWQMSPKRKKSKAALVVVLAVHRDIDGESAFSFSLTHRHTYYTLLNFT